MNVPDAGLHLWNWYHDLSRSVRRVRDGVCEPIPPSEFIAWKQATKREVYPHEYEILREMDVVFVSMMNDELEAYRERTKPDPDKGNVKGRRR